MRSFLIAAGILLLFSACNKDQGNVTLTYHKASAVYGDIDQVRTTPLMVASKTIENPGKIFYGEQFLLVGEEGEGIHVFDNTNPNSPLGVGFIQLPFTKEFYVQDQFVYAESHYDFVKIDLSVLTAPTMVDRVEYAFADPIMNDKGEVLLGFNYDVVTESFALHSAEAKALEETNMLYMDYMGEMIPPSNVPSTFAGSGSSIKGTLNKIAVTSNHAYVIGDDEIYTFRNDPSSMSYVGATKVTNDLETIYPENNRLYLGTARSMEVMDVAMGDAPQHISSYDHPTSCDPVMPYGNVAYLTLRTGDFSGCNGDQNTLDVIDISNISEPEIIEEITMTSPYGMCVSNNYLFVGEGTNGLSIFNISDPTQPILAVTHTGFEVYDILPHPTDPNKLLAASEIGLVQYQIDYSTLSVTPVSSIAF